MPVEDKIKIRPCAEIIADTDLDVLVGLVMQLTGGSVNPSLVRVQAARWKARIAAARARGRKPDFNFETEKVRT